MNSVVGDIVSDMRVAPVFWSQTFECFRECALQTFYFSMNSCQKMVVAHGVLSPPYPNLDVVIIAAPTCASQC